MAPSDTPTPPSADEQMAAFKGFATKDGEVIETPKKPAADTAKKPAAADGAKKPTADQEGDAADGTEEGNGEVQATDEDGEVSPGAEGDEAEREGDGEDDEADKPQPKKAGKPKRSVQEVINRQTRARRDAERALADERRRTDALERRLAALEQRGLTKPEQSATEKDNDPDRPQPDKYEYGELDVRYISDLARYEARKELRQERQAQEQRQQSEAASRQATEFAEKRKALATKGAEKYDDFDEVVFADDVPFSPTIGELILGSDQGHEVAYHLASNPDEARKVFGMAPLAQAAYFGRLEAKFASQSDAQPDEQLPVKTTKAPPPPKMARGKGQSKVDADTPDFAAFEAMAKGNK